MVRYISRLNFLKSLSALGTSIVATACSSDRKSIFDPMGGDGGFYGDSNLERETAAYAQKYLPKVEALYAQKQEAQLTMATLDSAVDEMYFEAKRITDRYPEQREAYSSKRKSYGTMLASDSLVVLPDSTLNRIQPGDSDENGTHNIFDLLHMLGVLSGSKSPTAGTDADQNGTINIFDLLKLLGMYKDSEHDYLGPVINAYVDGQKLENSLVLQKAAGTNFDFQIDVADESGVKAYKTTVRYEDSQGQTIERIIENQREFTHAVESTSYTVEIEAVDAVGNKSSVTKNISTVSQNAFYGRIEETLSGQSLSGLEVELTLPNGTKKTAITDASGVYQFNAGTPSGYSTLKVKGVQEGFEEMYTFENDRLELSQTQNLGVQMIKYAEDPDNAGHDLLEHLWMGNGNGVHPVDYAIRWRDDLYPLKVFFDRENSPNPKIADLLKGGWKLWVDAVNKHLPSDRQYTSLFQEFDSMPEEGIHCTWNYEKTAQFVFEEWTPDPNPEYYTKGRVEWNGTFLERNVNNSEYEADYAALAAHEFGHALKVSNSPTSTHIMNGDYVHEHILKPADFEGLAAATNLKLKTHTPLKFYSKST